MHPLQHINLEHDAQMYITWTWTVYICEHMWYWHCDILPNYWIDKWSLHAYYASICIVYSARIQSGVHPKNLSRRLRIRAMEYSSNLLEQQHIIVQQSFFSNLKVWTKGSSKSLIIFCWSRRNAITSLPGAKSMKAANKKDLAMKMRTVDSFPFPKFWKRQTMMRTTRPETSSWKWKIALLLGWHLYIHIIYSILFSGAMLVRLVFHIANLLESW